MPITLHSPPKKNTKPPQLNSYGGFVIFLIVERYCFYQELIRFGDDLLSHVLRRSTIGATALNGWVRDGTRCFARAMITKPNKFLETLCAGERRREAGYPKDARSRSVSIGAQSVFVQVMYD